MSTYFFTWGSVLIFALLAKKTDFEFSNELSYGKVDHTSNAKLFFFIGSFILVFVAGCRYYIGSDYYAYYGWYQSYADSFNDRLVSFNEPGISFIYWIIVKFVNDGFACVFIANAVMIFLALRVLRNNTSEIAVALILYSLIFWVDTFNGMRQALAATIIFCGFKFLREKKLLNYCIVVFIAFLFHKSAVVLLLLYFIVHRKINWKNLLILVAITVIFIYSYDNVFNFADWLLDKELDKQGAYISNSVNILRVSANIAPAVYFLIRNWKKEKTDSETFYLNLLLIHGLVSLITINSAYLARLNLYTSLFEIIAICELLKKEDKYRTVITIVVIILFFVFQLYEVYISPDLSPFKWIWSR